MSQVILIQVSDSNGPCHLPATKQDLVEIHMKLSELNAVLAGVNAQLVEGKTEILAKITELEDSLGDVELSAESTALIEELKGLAQGVADVVVTPPPAP